MRQKLKFIQLQCVCTGGLSLSHQELWRQDGRQRCPTLRQEDQIFIYHIAQSLDVGCPWRGVSISGRPFPSFQGGA